MMIGDPRGENAAKPILEESIYNRTPAAKDPGKGHFYVSLVKSVIRIVGCLFLIAGMFVGAGVALLVAELLGILEEII